ncbi:MAG: restriction endonuclease subunit S [Syntrophorhabdaceae bacterium]|nr:restriction endonuclease subunit S [Syntrophorhabdaceae bacterium]MDD5242641.1 restriction endonuclease subunit S [Syntrophorhabdaceae bacterium]
MSVTIHEVQKLRDVVTLEKGKPPAQQPYFGSDAELYLTPEYLRGRAPAQPVKPSANAVRVSDDDTILLWDGSNAGEFFRARKGILASTMSRISHDDAFDKEYFFYAVKNWELYLKGQTSGSGIPHVDKEVLGKLEIYQFEKSEQAKIAEILSTVDRAIEQTEALIAKQQRIKTGLLQDLLTRGIDEHGNLRSEKTHKFKNSPLGRIPVEWGVDEFGRTLESAVDGPFGSNLKSDHYVAEPGVRVIRLGNIGNGKFLDQDKAWVSSEHGRYLSRHSVQPKDLLIASLGDERHPFGRACIYTDYVHEAIVKADVFRIRCNRERYIHPFAVHLFNFPRWRQGLFALAQGMTRDRVNLTNLMSLQLPIPPIAEQEAIACTISSLYTFLDELEQQLAKLLSLKTGLMQDLLRGKKRVTALLSSVDVNDKKKGVS